MLQPCIIMLFHGDVGSSRQVCRFLRAGHRDSRSKVMWMLNWPQRIINVKSTSFVSNCAIIYSNYLQMCYCKLVHECKVAERYVTHDLDLINVSLYDLLFNYFVVCSLSFTAVFKEFIWSVQTVMNTFNREISIER